MQQTRNADNILRKKDIAGSTNQAFWYICKNPCHNAGYRLLNVAIRLMLKTKTNTDFGSSSYILNSGRVSHG